MQMMLHERTGTAFGVAGGIYRAEGVLGFWRGNGAHSWLFPKQLLSSQLLPAVLYALREHRGVRLESGQAPCKMCQRTLCIAFCRACSQSTAHLATCACQQCP